MGKNNKARRAAKAKARAKARARQAAAGSAVHGGHEHDPFDGPPHPGDSAHGGPPGAGSGPGSPFTDAGWSSPTQDFTAVIIRILQSWVDEGDYAPRDLQRLQSMPAAGVYREAERFLLRGVDVTWSQGWQPAEFLRQARRTCQTAAAVRLVATMIAVDDSRRRADTLDSRWRAQVQELGLPAADGKPGWIRQWVADERLTHHDAVATIVDVACKLGTLPNLEVILPPPRKPGRSDSPRQSAAQQPLHGADVDPVLTRIRALLAKAEASTFEAEATAYTAKAQELMTRHAIDLAALESATGQRDERPLMIRVAIDRPYADAKSLLLQIVAEASRCRSVFHERLDLSTVAGFASDVAVVEVLFTSLLLQAQHAMAEAAAGSPAGSRTRRQSFRSAFLLAYAHRIGDRLAEINQAVADEVVAERGSAFLPVLRSRSDEVNALVQERFGTLTSSAVRGGYDALGWSSGRQAADRAKLNKGDLEE